MCVGATAPGHQPGALVASGGDVALHPVSLDGRDERAHDRVELGGVSHLERPGIAAQHLEDAVEHAALDDGPGGGGADLPGVKAPRRADAPHRGVEVGVVEDDAGPLAAQFEQEALHGPSPADAMRVPTSVEPGEADHVHVGRIDQRGGRRRRRRSSRG